MKFFGVARLTHTAPHGCRLRVWIARRQKQLRLIGLQRLRRAVACGPPGKTAFGKPLLRKPKALAVISQQANRGGTAAAKNENAAGEWIGSEFFAAQLHQGVYAFSSVDRLNGHQDPHLRRDLQHALPARERLQKLRDLAGAQAFQFHPQLAPAG